MIGVLCFMGKPKLQLKGKVFTYLTVIEEAGSRKTRLFWRCLCKCGKEVITDGTSIVTGHTKSCGCYSTELATTHKLSRSRIYKIWNSMTQRCENPNDTNYHNYGGRGIRVNPAWLLFQNFYNDMKEGYESHLTIERINNNLGYNKENCKWATWAEQSTNKRNSVFIASPWGLLHLNEVSEKSGIKRGTLSSRILRNWPLDKIFKTVQKRTYSK